MAARLYISSWWSAAVKSHDLYKQRSTLISVQAGFFTARLCPHVRMPPVRNARRTSCPIPSFERAQIPNFQTRPIPNLRTRPMSSCWTYLFAPRLCHTLPAVNGVVRCAMGTPQRVAACSESSRIVFILTGRCDWSTVLGSNLLQVTRLPVTSYIL